VESLGAQLTFYNVGQGAPCGAIPKSKGPRTILLFSNTLENFKNLKLWLEIRFKSN
jgi:hypothetical protein